VVQRTAHQSHNLNALTHLLFKVARGIVVRIREKVRHTVEFDCLFQVIHEARAVALCVAHMRLGAGRRAQSI